MEINLSEEESRKLPVGAWSMNIEFDPDVHVEEIQIKDMFGRSLGRILIDAEGNAIVHPPHRCEGCHRPYGDKDGFPDLVVPDDIWKQMMPGRNGGGLLCPSCMCHRAYDLGIECIARFTSGPFMERERYGSENNHPR